MFYYMMTTFIFDINGSKVIFLSEGLGHFQPERWKWYDNLYAVSDWGRVANRQTKRLVKQMLTRRGYAAVKLHDFYMTTGGTPCK